jgi:hypothetical protein
MRSKSELLGEKPGPILLFIPQVLYGVARDIHFQHRLPVFFQINPSFVVLYV